MKRAIAFAILLAGIPVPGTSRVGMPVAYSEQNDNPLVGKSGIGLVDQIRKIYRPARLVENDAISYNFYDPFTGGNIDIVDGKMPDGCVAGQLVPSAWWEEDGMYGDTISRDLNNFIPLMSEVKRLRGELPPGIVSNASILFPTWSVGTGKIYGTVTDLYSPPLLLRGRLARAFFYMAVMYPQSMFTARGYMMLSTGYPYLTTYSKELLCGWSAENEVNAEEIAWDNYVSGLQGGCNPFVRFPDLVEYIWGDKSGEPYVIGDDDRIPVHSKYRQSTDWLYLYSPAVPDDAIWEIDGVAAISDSYKVSDIGTGQHELSYKSASTGENGYVLIQITSD